MRRNCFTLMELIVVMILVGLLLGVAMPSFSKASVGQNLTNAASEVAGQIAIARAYSQANMCYTAIIFPEKSQLESLLGPGKKLGDTMLSEYVEASFRIAVVHRDDKDSYHFVMWMPGSSWQRLPQGAILSDKSSDFPTYDASVENVFGGALSTVGGNKTEDHSTGARFTSDRFIVINPDGNLVAPEANDDEKEASTKFNRLKVAFTDGVFNRATNTMRLLPRAPGKQAYLVLDIDCLTGRARQKTDIR